MNRLGPSVNSPSFCLYRKGTQFEFKHPYFMNELQLKYVHIMFRMSSTMFFVNSLLKSQWNVDEICYLPFLTLCFFFISLRFLYYDARNEFVILFFACFRIWCLACQWQTCVYARHHTKKYTFCHCHCSNHYCSTRKYNKIATTTKRNFVKAINTYKYKWDFFLWNWGRKQKYSNTCWKKKVKDTIACLDKII